MGAGAQYLSTLGYIPSKTFISQTYCGTMNMGDFVRGTTPHNKLSLHWSVIHYQVTFE